ncbi:MAG: hypothetical protein K6G42_03560 [Lachnospiraceae bacterium]|nr:hypothetical protein [Lachnospiraceae bacterium]
MERILRVIALISFCMILGGCSAGQPGGDSTAENDSHEEMTYMSPDGYQIRYNASNTESKEIDGHTVRFIYTGEPSGENMITVTYIPDRFPDEVLYEVTEPWGDQEAIARSEGFFPGTNDKWGCWRTFSTTDGKSEIVRTAIAGEYNGGVLMFESEEHMSGDEEKDMAISDELAYIVDSITYDKFEPQTMYSYHPGTYSSKSGKIILKDDHTGTLSFPDDAEITWGSYEITATDGSFTHEYSIEGDSLYLENDGEWVEFTK